MINHHSRVTLLTVGTRRFTDNNVVNFLMTLSNYTDIEKAYYNYKRVKLPLHIAIFNGSRHQEIFDTRYRKNS